MPRVVLRISQVLFVPLTLACGVIIGLEKERPSSDAQAENVTDSGYEGGEGQEPGDDASGVADADEEGCEICTLYCNGDSDCDDGNSCNGEERCDSADTHRCRPGATAEAGAACFDGLLCTSTDICDGAGGCLGSGNACNDAQDCTTDGCAEGPGAPVCDNAILDGYCFIDGQCHANGAESPGSQCRVCMSGVARDAWSPVPDMAGCAGGVCCFGECIVGGSCCSDPDCPSACGGTAAPCSDFSTPASCSAQSGCIWVPMPVRCLGTPAACSTYPDETSCSTQSGCAWGHRPCAGYICQ